MTVLFAAASVNAPWQKKSKSHMLLGGLIMQPRVIEKQKWKHHWWEVDIFSLKWSHRLSGKAIYVMIWWIKIYHRKSSWSRLAYSQRSYITSIKNHFCILHWIMFANEHYIFIHSRHLLDKQNNFLMLCIPSPVLFHRHAHAYWVNVYQLAFQNKW